MGEPRRPSGGEFLIPDRVTFLRALDLTKPALAPVRDALDAGDVAEAGRRFAAHFRRRDMSSPLLPDWSRVPRDPAHRNKIAEDCLRGRLVDGYNVYDVPQTGIDWVNAPLFCLPRFPIFPALTEAWHHTQDARYLRFIVDHTFQYMRAYPIEEFAGRHSNEGYRNHYLVGPPTWWCLEPNRLDAWSTALACIRSSPLITDEEILASLHRMLQEIRHFLTQVPFWLDQQHNVAGYFILVFGILARVFEDFTESARWLEDDARWLARYVEEGFYEDGFYKELTLGYSSSVVAGVSRIASVLSGRPEFAHARERLGRALTAMVGLVQPGGDIPSFGDFPGRPLAAVLYRPLVERLGLPWLEALLRTEHRDPAEEVDYGTAPPPAWLKGTPDAPGPEPPFRTWPPTGSDAWGGYYAMRSDWSRQARYLMVDGGPWGVTHQHMDRLSFVLWAHGASFLTDPVNTLYANNEPGARLSTLHAGFLHNTITVDGVDECVRSESEWATDRPLDNTWQGGDGWVLFAGRYDFSHHRDVQWERRILFVDGSYWLLQDVLTGGERGVAVEQNFQFEPDIRVELQGPSALAAAPSGARLLVQALRTPLAPQLVAGEEASHATYSTQYGVCGGPRQFGHGRGWVSRWTNHITPAPALTYGGRVELPCVITLLLAPLAPGEPDGAAPQVRTAEDGDGTLWRLPTRRGELRLRTSIAECRMLP